jgi:hypothetical protein
MRCEEVTRELAVPTGGPDPSELTEHLALCSSCSDWDERSRQFDRLWDATRPAVPSAEVWRSVWEHASRPASPAKMPFQLPLRWRQSMLAVMSLAQAAAIFMLGLVIARNLPQRVVSERVVYDEVEQSHILFITLDAKGQRVDWQHRFDPPELIAEQADELGPVGLGWDMELLGRMENSEEPDDGRTAAMARTALEASVRFDRAGGIGVRTHLSVSPATIGERGTSGDGVRNPGDA